VLRRRARHRDDHPAGLIRARLTLLAACLAVYLIAAGCGGDGDSGESSSTAADSPPPAGASPSTQAYVRRAIRVCATLQSDLQRVYTEKVGARIPSDAEMVRFTRTTAIPNVERQLAELRRLPQPRQDRETIEAYYAAYERGVAQLKQDPGLVTKTQIPPAFRLSNRIAIRLRMFQCVR
jgi:hypothetical protein